MGGKTGGFGNGMLSVPLPLATMLVNQGGQGSSPMSVPLPLLSMLYNQNNQGGMQAPPPQPQQGGQTPPRPVPQGTLPGGMSNASPVEQLQQYRQMLMGLG
jgi:hypothetical protein